MASGGEHRVGEVDADATEADARELGAKRSGAGADIEDEPPWRKAEEADGPAPPEPVEAEGHEGVQQVVAGRDGVEHGVHGAVLLCTEGEPGHLDAGAGRCLFHLTQRNQILK